MNKNIKENTNVKMATTMIINMQENVKEVTIVIAIHTGCILK